MCSNLQSLTGSFRRRSDGNEQFSSGTSHCFLEGLNQRERERTNSFLSDLYRENECMDEVSEEHVVRMQRISNNCPQNCFSKKDALLLLLVFLQLLIVEEEMLISFEGILQSNRSSWQTSARTFHFIFLIFCLLSSDAILSSSFPVGYFIRFHRSEMLTTSNARRYDSLDPRLNII